MDNLFRLHTVIEAVCPIFGVALTDPINKIVKIDYKNTANQSQKDAAVAILQSFDWSDAAQVAWEKTQIESKEPDLVTLRDQATQAISDINTFLAITSPSNAQVLAEVKAIDQRQRVIIKAIVRLAIKVLG